MNRTIWKYPLPAEVNEIVKIKLPEDSKIISVGQQYDVPYLWAEVYPEMKKMEEREIYLAETGKVITTSFALKPIGIIMLLDGNYILHVFEVL